MRVYVASQGVYSSRSVIGVYDSPERAMAAHDAPGMTWRRDEWTGGGRTFATWRNDQDWDAHVEIEPFELVTEGPVVVTVVVKPPEATESKRG